MEPRLRRWRRGTVGRGTGTTRSVIVALSVLGALAGTASPAPALSGAAPGNVVRGNFVGTDAAWCNPANWSSGRLPDARTDVILDGRDVVVIDPAACGPEIVIRDLEVRDHARLTTLAGTIMRTRVERVSGAAEVLYQSSEVYGERGDYRGGKVILNPTPTSKRFTVLSSTVAATVAPGSSEMDVLSFSWGIGGLGAASPGHVGPGHYATLTGEHVKLGGRLELRLLYGFVPSEGDEFAIVTADRITGQFDSLPDGALVARVNERLGMFIHYPTASDPTAGSPAFPKVKVTALIRVRPTGG